MTQFRLVSEFDYGENISSIEIADLTGDAIEDIVLTTIEGSFRILNYEDGKGLEEIARVDDIPPTGAIAHGRVLGQESYDFVLGGFDNTVRIISFLANELEVRCCTSLGALPTAICVTNVVDDTSAEVIVSSNDGSLRCYGWFDVALDKLAHKVIDKPTFSMSPLKSKGLPYSRFVFGDDKGNVYVYQYADDRLHEVIKAKVKGDVQLVASGNITPARTDDVVTVSNGRMITLFRYTHPELKRIDSLRAPNAITSVKIGSFIADSEGEGQILVSHGNSTIALLTYGGNRLNHITSIHTAKKSVETQIAYGDLTGDGEIEIIQSVGKKLFLLKIEE